MQDGYHILIEKLNRFIRKYYLNQMLRGLIWFTAVFALFFLLVTLFEYYSWSGPDVRTGLFYAYLAINLFILARLVVIPLLRLLRVGKVMKEEEAARIVGKHFPEVKDKLLNTIQLKKMSEAGGTLALLEAGIEQKTRDLHPVPFVRAIDLRHNRKYLRYALPPLVLILILLLSSPSTITEPSRRLIHHRVEYARPLPFTLNILNSSLEAVQQEDFILMVRTEGAELPASLQVLVGGSVLAFQKSAASTFTYTFNNLQQDLSFSILAEGYTFGPYTLRVMPKPIIINYELGLDYPAYTGKKDEIFENTGDFVVPEGTVVKWKVATRDTRSLNFRLNERNITLEAGSSNTFTHTEKLRESLQYSISVENEFLTNPDTLSYAITVIPDLYPTAIFEEFRDSVYDKRLYFQGQISDDYGFSDLTFNYEFLNHFDSAKLEGKVYRDPVAFSPAVTKQMVFHYFDLGTLGIGPGDEIAYYFEVWDNDGVNGAKSSRSHRMVFRAPTLDEITEQTEATNSEMKDEMEDIIEEARRLQKQIEKLNKQMINKENLSWQDKEQIRNLMQQQEQLHQRMELLQEKNARKNSREEEYKKQNDDILQKQMELQRLFDEVMTDEMKKMYEEIQKLLDELKKEDVNEMLEKMEMSASDIEQELDRNLELFKQLEFDKKLTETIEKLQQMAKEQQDLSEKTGDKDADEEKLQEEQEALNQAFEKLREDMDDIEKMNEELENKHPLQDTDKEENSIQQEMENSLEQMKDGQMKKAGQSQKKAGDDMQKLAEMMLNMQMQMYAESNAEDIRVLREILENLLVISFDQEDLIEELGGINYTDPRYQDLIQKQHEIKENMKLVEDSLYALSKRQTAIEPFVNKEVDNINKNIEDANQRLEDRRKGDAAASQQYVMTSVNNLALLLSEALQKMQQMQNMNMPSNASCDNPGQGSPSSMPQKMSEMQKSLNQQLQQMKNGQQGRDGQPKPSMSEQFARMAAEQEAIRRQMQQYLEELKKQGETGDAGLNQLMEEMEETELDLVNKRLTEETLKRQEEIMTRLLKHEKAMREREKEERRESTEAKNQDYSNPNDFSEYKKILLKEVELLKTVPPDLKPFYKRKVNEYFYNFGN